MGLQVDAVLFDDVVCNNQHGAEQRKEFPQEIRKKVIDKPPPWTWPQEDN